MKVLVLAFIAIALPFTVSEFFGEAEFLNAPFLRYLNRDFWFLKFAPGSPRQTRIDEFKIVAITRDVEPGSALGEFRCTHRAFMAKLLGKLGEIGPRLIIIDKWYGPIPPHVCTTENDGTPALEKAIQTISAKVPLVIALGSYNRDEVQQLCPQLQPEDLQKWQMILGRAEPLDKDVPLDRRQFVKFGLARMNDDPRKVPLGWDTFLDCKKKEDQEQMLPTVATQAAELLDPNIMTGSSLSDLFRRITHPYTKLARPGTFESISAIKLLCNNPGPDVDWTACGPDEGDKTALKRIRHNVAIIGEITGDTHQTDEGVITGPELQANYIAALLDQSILRPVSPWITVPLTIAWLFFLFWIFYGWKPRMPELAIVVSVLITFGLGGC